MRYPLLIPAIALLSVATSCVAPPRAPAPPPAARVVVPPPPATPVTLPVDWRDWPQTPGDWRYADGEHGSFADFGQPGGRLFEMSCDRAGRRVTLTGERAPNASTMTVRTTSTTRTLPIVTGGNPPAGGTVSLPAEDPLLDAMAFSRGRFVVEQPGASPLVLPAWAEVGRVVQDCRG